jgi:type IV secretion system protein VirB6
VLTVLVITITFTVVFATVMGMCMRLVAGFRLPDRQTPLLPEAAITQVSNERGGAASQQVFVPVPADVAPSRAARLAATLGAAQLYGSDNRAGGLAAGLARDDGSGSRRLDVSGGERTGTGRAGLVSAGDGPRLGQSWAASRQRRATPLPGGTTSSTSPAAPARLTSTRGTP